MKKRFLSFSIVACAACLFTMTSCSAAKAGADSDAAAKQPHPEKNLTQQEISAMTVQQTAVQASTLPYDGVYPQHESYGTGIGAMPGRVVWAHDPNSVDWDGNGWWWSLEHFDEPAIQRMVNDSITALGGKATAQESWAAMFQPVNQRHGKACGYTSGQKIAIKANINGSAVMDDDTSGQTQMSYTNPVLLKALPTSLVESASVAPSDITVYDVSRLFPDYMVEFCTQGKLNGIHFVGRDNGTADTNAPIQWSYPFSGKVNYLPTCVTEAEYIINLANLKGHLWHYTLRQKSLRKLYQREPDASPGRRKSPPVADSE